MQVVPIVIVGLGEMGGVFAQGFLHAGNPVYPVLRAMPMERMARRVPAPGLVLVAVSETDLDAVLGDLPQPWHGRVALLQNELLPYKWERFELDPTVIVVWFEKKPGHPPKVILPSVVRGSGADLIVAALSAIEIPVRKVDAPQDILRELVRKNLYILTSNIVGLKVGGTVGGLWQQHRDLTRQVAEEVLDIQEALTASRLPREELIEGMRQAFDADPQHKCTGRSAPARLTRALEDAERAGLGVPTLHRLRTTIE